MAKKKDITVKELVKSVEEMRDTGVTIGEEENVFVPTEDVPESVKSLAESFPSAEGYYGKIYKIEQTGDWQLKDYRIESPETIPDGDLEREVKNIVRQKKWGNGDYRVQIRRQNERSIYLNKKVVVDEPLPESGVHSNPIREQLGVLGEAVAITERLRQPQLNAETMGNVILKAVETGRSMSETKGGNGPDTQLINLIEKLSPIIVPFLTKPPLDENSIIEKIVTRLKADIPKEDNLTALVKLKDGLGLKFAHEGKKEDSIDSVKRVTDIVQALRPLTGAASGEPPSTLSLVLEHLPKLVEPLLSTFKEFAEAKKMEMQFRMDQYYGGERPAQIEGGKRNLPAPRIHPFATRIIKAVNENDESYFDMMRQQISRFYGQHVIDGLIDGSLTSDLVIETIHTELGVPLNLPNLKPYLDKFVKYLLGKNELENGKGILAECKLCKAQYDFPNMKTWEADGKKCEDCQADLELVKREGEA